MCKCRKQAVRNIELLLVLSLIAGELETQMAGGERSSREAESLLVRSAFKRRASQEYKIGRAHV